MSEAILLTCRDPRLSRDLKLQLARADFEVRTAADLQAATEQLYSFPALALLDMELAAAANSQLHQFAEQCQLAEIPCLCYSSNGMSPARMIALAPRQTRTIFDPRNPHEVLQQISTELQIRVLAQQQVLAEGRLQEKRRQLQEGLHSAEMIQHSLLPTTLPVAPQFNFSWRFIPCEQVGGDLVNLIHLDETTTLAYLLDVSGHGVSAAMVTVSVYQSLSVHTGRIVKQMQEAPPYYRIPGPAEVLTQLEQEYPFERFQKFFTISYLLLDSAVGEVRYCSGGHPPPVLQHADGCQELLEAGGPLIGMDGLVPFEEGRVQLQPGDRLYLYSDGITEYVGAGGELFGEERFFELLRGCGGSLDDCCSAVLAELDRFGAGARGTDDITLLGIEYRGASV